MPTVFLRDPVRWIGLAAALFAVAAPGAAQDVESFFGTIRQRIAEGKPVTVSGGAGGSIGLNAFRALDGPGAPATRRNAPFTWGGNAALNFDVLGVQAPFALAVASRNTRFDLPSYTFAGISPTYRWLTLHAGDRAMAFSPYSLSGIGFRGGGVEAKPGRWHVMAMGGRLRAERAADIEANQTGLALRGQRDAYGAKVGYQLPAGSSVSASVFSSRDELLDALPPADSLEVGLPPERNVVLTLATSLRLSPKLRFDAELARSSFTRDRRSPLVDDAGVATSLGGLLPVRTTTAAATAGKAALTFSPGFGQFTFGYERIGPEYRTHGSLFVLSDVENVTAAVNLPLFGDVVALSATGGLQRNDLAGDQAAELRRLVGALSLAFNPSERVTAGLSLSNLSATNRYKALTLTPGSPDSVVLAQAQFSADANVGVALDQSSAHRLSAQVSYQQADLIRDGEVDADQASTFGLASVSYAYRPAGSAGSASGSLVFNRTETADAVVTTLGPSVSYTRTLLAERANLSLTATYGINRAAPKAQPDPGAPTPEATTSAPTLQLNLGTSYALAERQSIGLVGSLLHVGTTAARAGFVDTQLGLTYGLSF